jgi:ABC-type phosphate transport system substrate-binding protein
MPNAIGYSGMGYKTDKVKFLKIVAEKGAKGVLPSEASAKDGSYPLTRPLQIYTKGQPQGAVGHYVQWILSAEGQEIVAAQGYGPRPPQPITAAPPSSPAAFQVTGSDTMLQLAQAWAAAYSGKYPNVKVQLTGGGSGVGIAGMIDGSVDIANASRKMKSMEIAKAKQNGVEPIEFEVAKDALSVYVHKDNPLDTVTIADLAQVYGEDGKISTWQQIDGYPKGNEEPEP